MNTALKTAAAAAIATVAFAGAAQAQDWYVRGDVGGTYQSEVNGASKAKGDTGWTVDGAVGRNFGDNFRAEAELLYSDADGKRANDGKLKTIAGFVNGYYDFLPGSAWRPFVGAGVGLGQVKVSGGPQRGDDTGFAYQLQAGVQHPINDRVTAQVAYRYLGINNVRIGSGPRALNGDYHDQALTVGVSYKFGS